MSSWTDGDLYDFDGVIGPLERAFGRRRIAVATDEIGRVVLVRPNSVVIDVAGDDRHEFGEIRDCVRQFDLDLMGAPRTEPASGLVAARIDGYATERGPVGG